MNKVLKLNFVNVRGKRSTIIIKNPKAKLDEATVRAAMDKIASTKIFVTKEGDPKFAAVKGANYCTTQSDDVFSEAK